MMMPRRGRIAVLAGEVVEGLDGLLNRFFFIPIKLPILKHELNFLANSGGNGWYGGRVEWSDLTALKIWKARYRAKPMAYFEVDE